MGTNIFKHVQPIVGLRVTISKLRIQKKANFRSPSRFFGGADGKFMNFSSPTI